MGDSEDSQLYYTCGQTTQTQIIRHITEKCQQTSFGRDIYRAGKGAR